jgi:hypothetical protein
MEMLCDTPISPQITEPLPSSSHFMAFISPPGGGKTSTSIAWLTNKEMYHKVFHNIYLVMPSNSRDSIKGQPFAKHDPAKMFDELTYEVLELVKQNCERDSREGFYSLLFLDDVASELKNNDIQRLLKQLVLLRRHLKLSIWCLSQNFNLMPLSIRKTLSHAVIINKPANKKELENVFTELVYLNKDDQQQLANHVWKQPHDFLFMDIKNGKLYRNFNRLEIE